MSQYSPKAARSRTRAEHARAGLRERAREEKLDRESAGDGNPIRAFRSERSFRRSARIRHAPARRTECRDEGSRLTAEFAVPTWRERAWLSDIDSKLLC